MTDPASKNTIHERVRRLLADFSVLSMPALAHSPELAETAERDLAKRARPGTLIYTAIWLIVCTWAGLWGSHTLFAVGNLAVLVALTAIRIGYHVVVGRRGATSDATLLALTVTVLAGALHWGVLSAWIISTSDFIELRHLFIVMLPAFAMGGTAVLGISRLIRQLYPCLVFVPPLMPALAMGGRENNMLVVLALGSLVYVLIASRTSAFDYWNAIHHATVANGRAELLELLSITDPLTGVPNRLCFNDRYQTQWAQCERSRTPLSLILVDLDHFKDVNDTYGHLAGDECLRKVADALSSVIRDDVDTLARYGGEEFVAILPGLDAADAQDVSERMVAAVAALEIHHDGSAIAMSCSSGVATALPHDDRHDSDRLLAAADDAMYLAKAGGRNRSETATDLDTRRSTPPDAHSTTPPEQVVSQIR